MNNAGAQEILKFLQDPKNKPLKDLIELAATEDEEALNYIQFIQDEISKKFKSVDGGGGGALSVSHLAVKLDAKNGQDSIRALDDEYKYYFNEYGKLTNEKEEKNNLSFDQYEKLGEELPFYMFHILINQYKFRAKIVGNKNIAKKKKQKKNDYKFKTVLFSPKFEQCDSIVVMIPPRRGGINYASLCIDEGLAYGTMLPYIDKILSWNPKIKKKKKKNDKTKKEKKPPQQQQTGLKRRWGIMILDPQGKDMNNNKYSIIKIFDKWLSKRIPSVGLFGFQPRKHDKHDGGGHQRQGSGDSIASSLSTITGSGPRIKVDIKNLFFIGGLHNGDLVSHLLHRRGQEAQSVIKGCVFLGSDDPYDVNDVTRSIYKECAINYLNSNEEKNKLIEGNKLNGDPFIIKRFSSGNPRYCCQSSLPFVIKYIQEALIEKPDIIDENEEEDDAKKQD